MTPKQLTKDEVDERFAKFVPDDPDTHWIEHNRERIEREAESDLPDAWVFERLLANCDEDR